MTFLIRGLARYAAASAMAGSFSSSNDNFDPDYASVDICNGVRSWRKVMRWLLPFAQATGYRIIIENPKSHQQIVIDKHTRHLPRLTPSWLRRYDKQELREWMVQEKENKKVCHIAEVRGRKRFGDSFTLDDKKNQ